MGRPRCGASGLFVHQLSHQSVLFVSLSLSASLSRCLSLSAPPPASCLCLPLGCRSSPAGLAFAVTLSSSSGSIPAQLSGESNFPKNSNTSPGMEYHWLGLDHMAGGGKRGIQVSLLRPTGAKTREGMVPERKRGEWILVRQMQPLKAHCPQPLNALSPCIRQISPLSQLSHLCFPNTFPVIKSQQPF